jgi:isoleucyl-tRNA synthetase
MSIEEFLEKYPKKTRLTEHPFGGETYTDILARLTSFVDEMETKHEGKTILIVTHGSPSRVLYKYLNSQSIIEDSDFLQTAQYHVVSPENQKSFADRFPANFIAEGQDQTRGWFYTLTVLSTALFDKPAFENVVVNGIVLAEDGKKMSKRLKNYPDPNHIFNSYGADSMRLYMLGSPVVRGDDFRFTERGVEQVMKGFLLPLWHSFSFFVTYANIDKFVPTNDFDYQTLTSSLDTWILARLHETIKQVDTSMQEYELKFAVENVMSFTDDLTNWYIRRSRRRFWKSENDGDKMQAYQTLWYVLTEFTKVLAPFAPYVSEYIYRLLTDEESSVHLQDFPVYNQQFIDQADTDRVAIVQKVVALGHKIRATENLKVRQPLALMEYSAAITFTDEEIQVIQEELNVKLVTRAEKPESLASKLVKPNARVLGPRFGKKVQDIIREAKAGNYKELGEGKIEVIGEVLTSAEIEIVYQSKDDRPVAAEGILVVSLDTVLTDELILEGQARDFVRLVQDLRKQADFHVADRIEIAVTGEYESFMTQFTDYVQNETLANSVTNAMDVSDIEHTDENGGVKLRKA